MPVPSLTELSQEQLIQLFQLQATEILRMSTIGMPLLREIKPAEKASATTVVFALESRAADAPADQGYAIVDLEHWTEIDVHRLAVADPLRDGR